jgi:DNA-binding MarR family transcriptional regulator
MTDLERDWEFNWRNADEALMTVSRAIRRAYDERLKVLGLNVPEGSALVIVAEFGPLSQSRLAARLGMGRARTGNLIDKLQERGYLERLADPVDRRVWQVATTRAATPIIKRVEAIVWDAREEFWAGIPTTQREQLIKVLRALEHNLAQSVSGEIGVVG